ncbi:MAG: hypothetical protein ACK4RT_10450 [Erythrobacter sp.]
MAMGKRVSLNARYIGQSGAGLKGDWSHFVQRNNAVRRLRLRQRRANHGKNARVRRL